MLCLIHFVLCLHFWHVTFTLPPFFYDLGPEKGNHFLLPVHAAIVSLYFMIVILCSHCNPKFFY